MLCDYSMVVSLKEISEVSFHLIGTNGSHRAENERFSFVGNVAVRGSNLKISRRPLAD